MVLFWFKGRHIGTGQADVKRYNRHLRDLIHTGRAKPSFIVSYNLSLDEVPTGYQHFDARATAGPRSFSIPRWPEHVVRDSHRPSTFGIFAAFPDDTGRQAHLAGRVAAGQKERGTEVFAQAPTIEKIDVLAAKLPG